MESPLEKHGEGSSDDIETAPCNLKHILLSRCKMSQATRSPFVSVTGLPPFMLDTGLLARVTPSQRPMGAQYVASRGQSRPASGERWSGGNGPGGRPAGQFAALDRGARSKHRGR